MEWEQYQTTDGRMRVNIGNSSYALLDKDNQLQRDTRGDLPGAELDPRQLGFVFAGQYGPVAQAWAVLCRDLGLPLRFAWSGVVNALGDHAEVSPAFKPKARDYGRA